MTKKQVNIFEEINEKGKKIDWKGRKLESLKIAKRLKKNNIANHERVYNCANYLVFLQNGNNKEFYRGNFCKNKLCMMCNWRKRLKYGKLNSEILQRAVKENEKGCFLFLTLTMKNVHANDLAETMKKMNESFTRLMKIKKIKKNMIGTLRSLEVTRNKGTGFYHPHLHVLLFVKSTYFKGKGNYINQKEWGEMWGKSADLEYIPIVDIRKVKPNNKKKKNADDLLGAVFEVSKYPTKPIEIIGDTEEEKTQITKELYYALKNKRQVGYSGLFRVIKKEIEKEQKQEKAEKRTENIEMHEVIVKWYNNIKNYVVEY